MARRHHRAADWLCVIGLIALVILSVAPAWIDALLAATAAGAWCYALERGHQEVTE